MTYDERGDIIAELRIARHDAEAFAFLVEAIAIKHERRRTVRQPEPEVEFIDEEPIHVG